MIKEKTDKKIKEDLAEQISSNFSIYEIDVLHSNIDKIKNQFINKNNQGKS